MPGLWVIWIFQLCLVKLGFQQEKGSQKGINTDLNIDRGAIAELPEGS